MLRLMFIYNNDKECLILLAFEYLVLHSNIDSNVRISPSIASTIKDVEATGEDVTALNEQLLESLRLINYEKDYVQK